MMKTRSRLAEVRKQRKIPVAELARSIGVSRQTVYAIEDGSYVPNTAVALRLSRELGVTVEELFSLDEPSEGPVRADLLRHDDGEPVQEGQPVRLCWVADRLIAVPSSALLPAYLPQSDGVVGERSSGGVSIASPFSASGEQLLLAGCDPALSLIGELLRPAGIDIIGVPAPSHRALDWLQEGKVHAAGSHLLDAASGTYNVPFVRRMFPQGAVRVITFATWQQGLLVKPGNGKRLTGISDLARKGVRFVNREEGSGSRKLLDSGLLAAGISPQSIRGYNWCAAGHLEVARRIAAGEADAGIATESAARCFGLDFVPLAVERFDLTMTAAFSRSPVAETFLNTLNASVLRVKLKVIAGCDTSETGKVQL
jgi:molybdopterin molybdotransferase/putative molybdopterin biosynthesis protein